eukprot:COSAG06_NODE_692_length_13043_cov_369.439509_5_plen_86_part_00
MKERHAVRVVPACKAEYAAIKADCAAFKAETAAIKAECAAIKAAVLSLSRVLCSLVLEARGLAPLHENGTFLSFPYACPEHVLVK